MILPLETCSSTTWEMKKNRKEQNMISSESLTKNPPSLSIICGYFLLHFLYFCLYAPPFPTNPIWHLTKEIHCFLCFSLQQQDSLVSIIYRLRGAVTCPLLGKTITCLCVGSRSSWYALDRVWVKGTSAVYFTKAVSAKISIVRTCVLHLASYLALAGRDSELHSPDVNVSH